MTDEGRTIRGQHESKASHRVADAVQQVKRGELRPGHSDQPAVRGEKAGSDGLSRTRRAGAKIRRTPATRRSAKR